MTDVANTDEDICAIYIDTGTTNTRGWLMRDEEILARGCRPVGVRDTARDQSPAKLLTALKELIGELQPETAGFETPAPTWVAAAGMISSPLGLAEVPHVEAPVGLVEIGTASRVLSFPEVTELPILLVAGVRSGAPDASRDSLDNVDVMRGEETLCFGLLQRGLVSAPAVVLTLGSHWKAIQIDSHGRIASSITSLSGELIHAVRTQTILASSVGVDWPNQTVPDWLEAGANAQRRSGLSRALFSVRLLELKGDGSPEDRLSYLLGAFIAADLDALVAREVIVPDTQVIISGDALIAEAWASALSRISVTPRVLSESETETAFLTGLRSILQACNHRTVSVF